MCSRPDAIRFLITNQFGSKNELVAKITSRQYQSFITTGMIYEPASVSKEVESTHKVEKEWITTKFAYERAKSLNLKPNKKYRLDSTPRQRIYSHQNVLVKLFGLIGLI